MHPASSATATPAPALTISYRALTAIAVGIAMCLVAIGAFIGTRAGAAPRADEATFVPIVPCRLFDTRPTPDTVGLRSSALGPGDTHEQQVTGDNGRCTAIPADAMAISLNVTAVNGSTDSFLTVYPADATERPGTSNLNWRQGAPPTPNKVDVKLSADGKLRFFNQFGTVNVIADVMGFYTHAGIADLEARLTAAEAQLAALPGLLAAKADSATIAPALADAGGTVATDGTKSNRGSAFGSWTVSRVNVGNYLLTFPLTLSNCSAPLPVPLVIPSATGIEGKTASVGLASCSPVVDTVAVQIFVRDAAGAATDGPFEFVAYLPPPN